MMDKPLDKIFDFAAVEDKIYASWEAAGVFAYNHPSRQEGSKPYTIMMPPPNITGSLHMGHALDNTLQDILIRYYRLQGRKVHWQVGTDHASIATQQVVERQLAGEGMDRHQLGREKFLERIWRWKAESGGMIISQLRRLGASPDWNMERFTMDEGLSRAVIKSFVALYKDDKIYRAKKIVNWDPKMETAISDLEIVPTEVKGKLYYIRYPLEQGGEIVIATTRPETMLGDTAVAVNPDDDRYRQYIGQFIIQPITQRRLPIIADNLVDKDAGSGVLKVTPSSDPNDFLLYQKHNLNLIEIFDKTAHLLRSEDIPEQYRGMERFTAREKIITELGDLVLKVEDIIHTVPYGDRGGVPLEYLLTEQWFVKTDELAKSALAVVKDGKIKFFPKNWQQDYERWLENIEPWCISRQLWWGHRIPAYYAPDGKIFVAENLKTAEGEAEKYYGKSVQLQQDEDVLDTWFSSALWPFSTLGWPDDTDLLKKHYPTDVLVTGFDIIFFWVARMVMMGLYFMDGEVPFRHVYVHALLRDAKGQKMSKSKGNVIDPIELVDTWGTDAVRFTLTALSSPGRDIKLSEDRMKGYRNFITKLWNGARFCQLMVGDKIQTLDMLHDLSFVKNPINRWMITKIATAEKKIIQHITNYRFDYYANELHHLVWHEFCDWYLEMVKPILQNHDHLYYHETVKSLLLVLRQLLLMLHPTIPFVTEEIYQHFFKNGKEDFLSQQAWLPFDKIFNDEHKKIENIKTLVEQTRSLKVSLGIDDKTKLFFYGERFDDKKSEWQDAVLVLGNLVWSGIERKGKYIDLTLDDDVVGVGFPDDLPLDAIKEKLKKQKLKSQKDIATTRQKTDNKEFINRAKPEVIQELQDRLAKLLAEEQLLQRVEQNLLQ